MNNKIYIGLGSNVGDRVAYIKLAIQKLISGTELDFVSVSSFYETKPYGNLNQNSFINAVLCCKTKLEPLEIFTLLKKTEKDLGRVDRERWGPREIDLDILLFGDLVIETDKLVIPHKELELRDFVLIPLIELDENLVNPRTGNELKKINFSKIESNIIRKFDS